MLLILAGVTIATLTGDNGLLQKAANSKQANEKGEIEEQIKLAYNDWKLRKETGETVDLQNTVQTTLDKMYDNVTINKQGKSIIINVKGNEFTLIDDGTMEEGQLACLDIADGNIDLYSNGYKQYTGNLQNLNKNGATQYTGKYIITGTTTENVVRVCDEGTFDITIKDLKIDCSNLSSGCPFSANAGNKAIGCIVNLILKGNNYFQGKLQPGLSAGGGTPNIGDVTDGSTLIIRGSGNLETKGDKKNGSYGMPGIGGNTKPSGYVSNIIIEGGNIIATGNGNAAAIGGGLYDNVNNIIINNGNVTVECGSNTVGVGVGAVYKTVDNIIINGGNINLLRGKIGSYLAGSGTIQINGANIKGYKIGGCSEIKITGGNLNLQNNGNYPIDCAEGGSINITGGNILVRGKNNINIGTYEGDTLVPYTPKNGESNLYETPIKLQGVGENKKITKLTTSDNINYGINDMYTLENGMLYLYLPLGERTITIEVEGKTYSGSVQTTETPVEVTLSETN